MCRVIDGYFISLRKAWLLRKIGKQQLATSVLAWPVSSLAVPNVTAHPSTAGVPTSYYSLRVKFRLCVLVHRCLHSRAPSYLADDLQLTSAVGTRRQLRSADSPTLMVRSTRRSMLGDRAFPVAAARAWNSLPPAVRDAASLPTFRSRLKTWLFELTLAWHWPHSPAALHFVFYFNNSVKCPCNVIHDSVTVIFTFLIINNNNNYLCTLKG